MPIIPRKSNSNRPRWLVTISRQKRANQRASLTLFKETSVLQLGAESVENLFVKVAELRRGLNPQPWEVSCANTENLTGKKRDLPLVMGISR